MHFAGVVSWNADVSRRGWSWPGGAETFSNVINVIIISLFLSFFVSLSATLRENGWTDLHEIFREAVEWPWDDLTTFWVNSGKRVGGSKDNFLSSKLLPVELDISFALAWWQHFLSMADKSGNSVSFARWQQGVGLLCLAPQLVFCNFRAYWTVWFLFREVFERKKLWCKIWSARVQFSTTRCLSSRRGVAKIMSQVCGCDSASSI